MDWANESYVRLYTRRTKTSILLGWEGQCVLFKLFCVVDRSGYLDDIDKPSDVALFIEIPVEIIEIGISRLLKLGVITIKNNRLFIPNFVDAQTTPKSNAKKCKDHRDSIKDRNKESEYELPTPKVSKTSKNDTERHRATPSDTPSLAYPNQAEPMLPEKPPAPPVEKAKKVRKPTGQGTPTWIAYSEAYQKRYGVGIERSQKISSQCLDLFKRLGEEDSPRVATFYFQSSNQYYQTRYHPLDLLVKDCETIKAEMIALNKKRAPYKPLVSKRPDNIF